MPSIRMRAALDRLERGEAAQQRALAGAARADHHQDLAGGHLEVDVVENGVRPVALDQPSTTMSGSLIATRQARADGEPPLDARGSSATG